MKRISRNMKSSMVLRLLRGESIDEVSRSEEVTVSDLSKWRDQFLLGGNNGLKNTQIKKNRNAEYERVIGKLQMENELLKKKSSFKNLRSL